MSVPHTVSEIFSVK